MSLRVFVLLLCLSFLQGQESEPTLVGPEKGSLYIVGGGRLSDEIILRFIEMAGGKGVPFVVIPSAGGEKDYTEEKGDFLRRLGASQVTVLHTLDRKVADSEAFCQPLLTAKALWFHGGRQWHLVDAYKNTLAEKRFHEVLARGGVIGGSSAGATIQGSCLVRGDTKNNQIMLGDHQEGFGFMKNTAIDQHVIARNRHFDLFEVLQKKPELFAIGIDETTAIEVTGDQFVVSGESYALVYDNQFWSREGSTLKTLPAKSSLFYFLRPGDRYDLKNRKVIEAKP